MERSTTIRSQMVRAIGTVISIAVVLLVIATLYIAKNQLYALGRRYAVGQAEAVAAQAGFSVIVGRSNPKIADSLLEETVGHGNILAGELLDVSGTLISKRESGKRSFDKCNFKRNAAAVSTEVREVDDEWCLLTPIFERRAQGLCRTNECVIGFLRLVESTHPVEVVVVNLIAAIFLMGLAVLVAALVSLRQLAERISSPLRALTQVMRRYSAGERSARAPETGPDETRAISTVYNALIGQQEEHARHLEERVAQRTEELHAATLAAQNAERYKTTFMAQMSHEMRTPLHIIQGQASEVLHELEFWRHGDRARENVGRIIQVSSELAYRVNQILDLVRGDSSGDEVQLETVALSQLKSYVLTKCTLLAEMNGNQLLVEADQVAVDTDLDKVVQILNNLVDNACKYTTGGTISVMLRAIKEQFVITVADTGAGIPTAYINEVWNDFRQVQLPDGRRPDGFGLGLAIVRRHATRLGGSCELSSTVGVGTTITITLPSPAHTLGDD